MDATTYSFTPLVARVALLTVQFEEHFGDELISLSAETIPKYDATLHRSPSVSSLHHTNINELIEPRRIWSNLLDKWSELWMNRRTGAISIRYKWAVARPVATSTDGRLFAGKNVKTRRTSSTRTARFHCGKEEMGYDWWFDDEWRDIYIHQRQLITVEMIDELQRHRLPAGQHGNRIEDRRRQGPFDQAVGPTDGIIDRQKWIDGMINRRGRHWRVSATRLWITAVVTIVTWK